MKISNFISVLSVCSTVLFLSACGGGGDSAIANNPPTEPSKPVLSQINVSAVNGNTASYNSVAEFMVSLSDEPSSDVVVPVSSSDGAEGKVIMDELVFTPDDWFAKMVVVKGRNQNVVNGEQDYQIILGEAQSGDERYNGVDPEDVKMKGIYLSLSAPNNIQNFISGIESSFNVNTTYTGRDQLSYSLDNAPEGMVVDINSGLISWTAPESDEGKSHTVKVKVNDGGLFEEFEVDVSVVITPTLETKIENNIVSVVDEGSNLNGLKIDTLGSDGIEETKLDISTIASSNAPPIPNTVTNLSGIFVVKNTTNLAKITLPPMQLPEGRGTDAFTLYNYRKVDDFENDKIWLPIYSGYTAEKTDKGLVVSININNMSGMFFIGIEERNTNTSQVESTTKIIQNFENKKCESAEEENTQVCSFSDTNLELKIIGFGNVENPETNWGDITVSDLIEWISESQIAIEKIGMQYSKGSKLTILVTDKIEGNAKWENDISQMTLPKKMIVHTRGKLNGKSAMKAVVSHEYFHHAQLETLNEGLSLKRNNFMAIGSLSEGWISEGTARWFDDYIDDNGIYTSYEHPLNKVLEKGLNYNDYRYKYFAFWKLVHSRCNFENKLSISKIIKGIEPLNETLGVSSFKNLLSNSTCNFGPHLGQDKAASLEAALLYYQYATLYKNKISLLDSNEDDSEFKFMQTPYVYEQSDWGEVNEVDSTGSIDVSNITSIPAYGAYSIKIKSDLFTNANLDEEHEAILKVKASQPLTVSLLSEHSSFTGNSKLDGIEHRHYKTNEMTEYIFSPDELVDYFITLVNPNGSNSSIEELSFEIRKKLSPELEITSPIENSNVNQRVISVSGKVPDEASDVNRIIVSNGGIKTTTIVDNKTFKADVVATIGSNTLIVQGYNSTDLKKPLTKEKIINITGIENTSGGVNALIPSRVAFVLRWKTNGTDIDLYSADKNNGTIWYRNPTVLPGLLDHDNTVGYGPEVISYRKTDDDVFVNGKFDVDVHFYLGTTPTPYSIDVILNETDNTKLRVHHYESTQPLLNGNPYEYGAEGSGASRFNGILSVGCGPQKICSIGFVDSDKLSNNLTSQRVSQIQLNSLSIEDNKFNTSHERCMYEYNKNLQKVGYVNWSCNNEGGKVWN